MTWRRQTERASEARWRDNVPIAEAQREVERLVRAYGSVLMAATVYAERHGTSPFSAARMMARVRRGRFKTVSPETYDRLSVTL